MTLCCRYLKHFASFFTQQIQFVQNNLHFINTLLYPLLYISKCNNTFFFFFSFPRCSYDYIDVYIQIKNASANILDAPLDGRFCGSNPDDLPYLLVSMYNVLIIGFYAEQKRLDNPRDVGLGFRGFYQFKDAGN